MPKDLRVIHVEKKVLLVIVERLLKFQNIHRIFLKLHVQNGKDSVQHKLISFFQWILVKALLVKMVQHVKLQKTSSNVNVQRDLRAIHVKRKVIFIQ